MRQSCAGTKRCLQQDDEVHQQILTEDDEASTEQVHEAAAELEQPPEESAEARTDLRFAELAFQAHAARRNGGLPGPAVAGRMASTYADAWLSLTPRSNPDQCRL